MDSSRDKRFYIFLHRQIPVFILLSLLPGLGYLFLGWLNNIFAPAFVWYLLVVAESAWGYSLYRKFDFDSMSERLRNRWYRRCTWFFYSFFLMWTIIFLLYVVQDAYKLHYIAIFTEIGASIVASSLLASDRRLYKPTILILMVPLIIYFALVGEWYGYILAIFACTMTWVLFYAAHSSNQLLMQANYQATHDALTGLRNRQYIIEHLQKRMNTLRENNGYSYLLLIDLDHFKTVNDSLGHDVGDHLLQSVAQRLQQIPKENLAARLGGDEFIITGANFTEKAVCERVAMEVSTQLIALLKEAYVVDRHHLYITASIGVSLINGRSSVNAQSFIKEADIAMYEVKEKGRDGVFMFNEEMSERVESNLEIERLLHFALPNNEITLHFQPQVDRAGKVIGAESLVRWNNAALGPVFPDQFITLAEQTGLIIELGKYILESAFKTLREWSDEGIELQQLSINISMRQITHYAFVQQVEEMVQHYLDWDLCGKLVFEITESIVAEDISQVISVMNRLRTLGIRFSMDDFGTGYSSLSYLNKMPLDEIKIDRSFVATLNQNERDEAMVVTILNMANILKLNIVAEGVETAGQLEFLLSHGCHIFQGYYYSRPLPKDQFTTYYRNHTIVARA